jgi:tetratricopeptide (TPR) repeat protein
VLTSLFKHVLDGARAQRDARRRRAADSVFERARELECRGDRAGSRALCEEALSRDARHADAHCMLGRLFGEAGELDRAFLHLSEAARLAPDLDQAHFGLGNVYQLRGQAQSAAESYRRALAANPELPAAHFSLGIVLRHLGQLPDAIEHFRRAGSLSPALTDAFKECALCQVQLGAYSDALATVQYGLDVAPEAAELHAVRGVIRQAMHEPQAALEAYERAQSLGHADAELWKNLGIVYQELGRLPEALVSYDRALALKPDFPIARFHRALAELLAGDYANGWPDYELRLISEDRPPRASAHPRWDGSALAGRTILVYGEQGLGDEIMFASCLPEIIDAAGLCIIECSSKLEQLFRRSFPRARVYAATLDRSVPESVRAEAIDCEVPSGSLPLHLRRSIGDFPQHQGYLAADPQRVGAWRKRLRAVGPGLKVGISWRGGTHQTRSPLRSIPLSQWEPVFKAADAHFVSLQYGECRDELDELAGRQGIRVTHWQEAIDDHDETAALVNALDLMISVCTAVIHVSGALGRPVWIMAPYSPEWRYGFAGETMPWYPSVRIFRQPSFGNWPAVISTVARELSSLESLTDLRPLEKDRGDT